MFWRVVVFTGLLQLVAGQDHYALYRTQFDEWTKNYEKDYSSPEEREKRLSVFIDNAKLVEEFNAKGHSYQMGLNKFADLSFEEFSSLYLSASQDCSATSRGTVTPRARADDIPSSIDWRQKGVITPVKFQGICGSCWTFSATGCLEAHHAIKTGELISMSEQQLVDCAGAFNNHGCDGGLPSQAYEYIMYNGGIESEVVYPYKGHDETCQFDPTKVVATVSGVVNVTQGDEATILEAVGTIGPVSIAFDVTTGFMLYRSGVYSSVLCSDKPEKVNHAVLAVGYNSTLNGEDYWIVKNSWGKDWGQEGYFWIERGKNMCGLADCASYPLV